MNLNEIKELIALIDASSLTKFEIEKDGLKILIKKEAILSEVKYQEPIKAKPEIVIHETRKEEAAEAAPAKVDENLEKVSSPIVGTFYSAPGPDSPDYVKVGDRVKKGQVLCIVEAMKLMNEITSEFDGEIVSVLCQSGSLVEYGQPLFEIRRA